MTTVRLIAWLSFSVALTYAILYPLEALVFAEVVWIIVSTIVVLWAWVAGLGIVLFVMLLAGAVLYDKIVEALR